ncbi:hypothetical protein D3C86_2168900 [compost metagenome]
MVTVPGVQLLIFSSLLMIDVGGVVGGVTGVLTETSLPDVSNVIVEAIGSTAPVPVGEEPSGLRPSIRV